MERDLWLLPPVSEARSRTLWALLLSVLSHGLLVFSIRVGTADFDAQTFAPLRLRGQTFEVDALHELPLATDTTATDTDTDESATTATDTEADEADKGPERVASEPHAEPEPSESGSTEPGPTVPPSADPTPSTGPSLSGREVYGEEGEEETRRMDLTSAFLKALPLAAKVQPAWLNLPEGDAGEVEFELVLDGDGRLQPITVIEHEGAKIPEYLALTVTKTRAWLLTGQFALHGPSTAPLEELPKMRLKLTATVSRKTPDPERTDSQGIGAFGLRGSPPSGAYLTYFSGQHVELKLEIIK